jgi:hypothetical protein
MDLHSRNVKGDAYTHIVENFTGDITTSFTLNTGYLLSSQMSLMAQPESGVMAN